MNRDELKRRDLGDGRCDRASSRLGVSRVGSNRCSQLPGRRFACSMAMMRIAELDAAHPEAASPR